MSEFSTYLQDILAPLASSPVKEAMTYSLMNGGKRVRPQLLFDALEAYGFPVELGYPMASAIEMIHTYSLIHDDLPAMDDDDLRRGKPSCHKAFDEATAILAGDGLLTYAFQVALASDVKDEQKVCLIEQLSKYAGCDGMILGQSLDLQAEQRTTSTLEQILEIDRYKTGQLLILPLVSAAILADRKEDLGTWIKIGTNIGIQFQIIDDILDATSTEEEMGKSLSDARNDKATIVSLLGIDQAKMLAKQYKDEIDRELAGLNLKDQKLRATIDALLDRKK
ncbi:hypothetical protein C815_00804 [Firmicutes bacterium M10-2]|nr:hypothetical protein C815_00804 [Firmicutes bacterium M10-2]